MQEVFLHGKEFENQKELHDYLKDTLNFPDYYGRNLSALYDVLTDICEDTKIVLNLSDVENEEVLDYLERVAEVMADAAESNMYLEFVCEEV